MQNSITAIPPLFDLDAIFFDFDGVLVDSLHIKADMFCSLFTNESESNQAAIKTHFYQTTGRSRQEKFKHIYHNILQRSLSNDVLEALCEEFRQKTLNAVIACKQIRGAEKLLAQLPKSMLRFVVSGTPESELQEIVRARGWQEHFHAVLGTPTRKELNMANLIEQYSLDPDKCIMLGDGIVDFQSAQHNNMPFLGIVADGSSSPFPANTQTCGDMEQVLKLAATASNKQTTQTVTNATSLEL